MKALLSVLVSNGDCRLFRLRGGRSYADSARGTYPSGLPFTAAAGELVRQPSLLRLALPAKGTAGRVGEYGKSLHP